MNHITGERDGKTSQRFAAAFLRRTDAGRSRRPVSWLARGRLALQRAIAGGNQTDLGVPTLRDYPYAHRPR